MILHNSPYNHVCRERSVTAVSQKLLSGAPFRTYTEPNYVANRCNVMISLLFRKQNYEEQTNLDVEAWFGGVFPE